MIRYLPLAIALLPICASALSTRPCPPKLCTNSVTCAEKADWIVEGVYTPRFQTIWLEEASLVRGQYPVHGGTTYLADSDCWKALPGNVRQQSEPDPRGKKVRAYGVIPHGLVHLEVLP
jgi:hypothetical protein